jgi:multidrug efflux pump
VPVSLVGTFAVMYLCGFSLNNLSLMALILATGWWWTMPSWCWRTSRHIEGESRRCRPPTWAQGVGFTLLSMNVSLVAVFVSILFMGGIVRGLFKEFSITLAAAIIVSLVVSLTLTPMLCARWLKPHRPAADPPAALERPHPPAHGRRIRSQPGLGAAPQAPDLLSLLATIGSTSPCTWWCPRR